VERRCSLLIFNEKMLHARWSFHAINGVVGDHSHEVPNRAAPGVTPSRSSHFSNGLAREADGLAELEARPTDLARKIRA
jgi:hypothetical protein